MRKLFTLALLSLIAVGVSAQNYRKWDFTNWSAETIANLAEEATKGVIGQTPRRPMATTRRSENAIGRMATTLMKTDT